MINYDFRHVNSRRRRFVELSDRPLSLMATKSLPLGLLKISGFLHAGGRIKEQEERRGLQMNEECR
jgi:hypothetical protein